MARQQLATFYRIPRAKRGYAPPWAISPPGALSEPLPDGAYHPETDGIAGPSMRCHFALLFTE